MADKVCGKDYYDSLYKDLIEQFRCKENIKALLQTLAIQLEDLHAYFDDLNRNRDVYTAQGKNLDGVGNIVDLTRMQAGLLAGDPIPFDILNDEQYRHYLIYKILINTCDCTYPDIIKGLKMFWDRPLYYQEDPAIPATMLFETEILPIQYDTEPLFRTPLIRAAGVTLVIRVRKRFDDPMPVYVNTGTAEYTHVTVEPYPVRRKLKPRRVCVSTGTFEITHIKLHPVYSED